MKKSEKKTETYDPLEMFEKATLDFFDSLLNSDNINKKQLADRAGGVGKYLLKHAVAINAEIEFDTLKDKDFVMVPHSMTTAMRQMVNGFEDAARDFKKKSH